MNYGFFGIIETLTPPFTKELTLTPALSKGLTLAPPLSKGLTLAPPLTKGGLGGVKHAMFSAIESNLPNSYSPP